MMASLRSPFFDLRSRHLLLTIRYLPFIFLAFLLRLAPLGRYVTPDEPAWVYRSIRFADALSARDWAAIPSTGHPGATTMWLGAAGVAVQRLLDPSGSAVHLDWIRRLAWLAPENGEAFRHLAFFLPWGRVVVALFTTLCLVVLLLLLVRLFDRRVALLTVGLLACDPFLVGHSGLLHTDALLATFILLTLVAALNGLREPRRAAWWVLSGFSTGLALLTKAPALILLPFILFLLAISALRRSRISSSRCKTLGAPVSGAAHARNGHSLTRFSCSNRPRDGGWEHWKIVLYRKLSNRSLLIGPLFHCLLFSASLLVTCLVLYPAFWVNLTGELDTIFAFAGGHVGRAPRPVFFAGQMTYDPGPAFYPVVFILRISPLVLIGLVAGLVTLRRLPSDRRWVLLLLLAFAVAFGALMSLGVKKHDRYLLPVFPPLALAAALGWQYLGRRVSSTRTSSAHVLVSLLQLILTIPFALRPLTAFNLLAGGPWVAARVLPVDWGEGMGAAARWLNQLPDADRLTVAAASVPSFAPLFEGRTVPLDQSTLADYTVLGPNQPTNQLIYTNTAPFEQSTYLAEHAGPDDLILLDADTPLLRHYVGSAALVSVPDLPDQAAVAARLAELSAGRSDIWLVSDPAASPITAAHLRRELEIIAAPISTAAVGSATITRYANPQSLIPNPQSLISNFDDQLTLIDTLLPARPVNAPFPVYLRWQAPNPTSTDLHASLYLRDSSDHLWAEVGQPVLNDVTFPTSAWASGEWADNVLTLGLPQRVLPGAYAVHLTVTDAEGAQLGAWDAGAKFQGVRVSLGDVEIAPPAEPVGPPGCAEGRAIAADPFLVCVPDLPPQTVPAGDALALALTWSAVTPPQADYTVRWRLLDGAGSVVLEQIDALAAYVTSRWRAGDSFEVRYDLRFDPTLPPAAYGLACNVLDADGRPLWPTDESLTSVEILPRDRLFELPPDISHPLDLTLGDTVHLRGFDLDRTQAAPGDVLPLTLYWQAAGPTDIDYTIFVHLVGPDGRPHGQVDFVPAGGAAPTTSWVSGQVIVDEIALPAAADAPAGPYHIAVGMYDAVGGGRLPVTDSSGILLPDDQAILPVVIAVAGGQP